MFQQFFSHITGLSGCDRGLNVYFTEIMFQTLDQRVYTQIRPLLEEQTDQGMHCLPFCLHLLRQFSTALCEYNV